MKRGYQIAILITVTIILISLVLSRKTNDPDNQSFEPSSSDISQNVISESGQFSEEMINPWDETGAKQPDNYTYEEFEALTAAQQIAFQEFLGAEAFDNWLNEALPEKSKNPWEKEDAKQPQDYTYEEYGALTAAQQTAFQETLGEAAFADWWNMATGVTTSPWGTTGEKQPQDYTYAEFEALTAAQQTAFQNYLGEGAFDNWLDKALSETSISPWNKAGAKRAEDYTYEEYEALTGVQQSAFQNYLGTDAFNSWLDKVLSETSTNPWEKAGAKKPEKYTYAEFEALTGEQQMAFQKNLGAEAFEQWLENTN